MIKGRVLVITVIILSIWTGLGLASIAIDPGRIEIIGKKGEQIKGTIIVENKEQGDANVEVYTTNWFKQDVEPDKWLKFDKSTFLLKVGEKKEIGYTIDIPKDAEGELMGMSFFTVTPANNPVGMEISVPFYVAISGTINLKIDILGCYLSYSNDVLEGVALIRNEGNVHLRPDVKVVLENKDENFYNTGFVYYGRVIKKGEDKAFSFTITNIKGAPRKCKATVIVNYGVAKNLDNKEEKSFDVDIALKEEKDKPKE